MDKAYHDDGLLMNYWMHPTTDFGDTLAAFIVNEVLCVTSINKDGSVENLVEGAAALDDAIEELKRVRIALEKLDDYAAEHATDE